jgi:hypothetical protein
MISTVEQGDLARRPRESDLQSAAVKSLSILTESGPQSGHSSLLIAETYLARRWHLVREISHKGYDLETFRISVHTFSAKEK